MPRPDLQALGIKYRRIPLCAIGKDVYIDTRIILQKLEKLFPEGKLGATDPDQRAMQRLLEAWKIEAGVFVRGSQLIPSDTPLVKDEKFQKDREDFSGRKWTPEAIDANRPEALAAMKSAFSFMETTLLADGRDWVLKTKQPSLSDIEGEFAAR
jgi:glutathione S-transferase